MSAVDNYILLAKQYVTGEITVSHFEVAYLEMFKKEVADLPEDIFVVLNTLFMNVDAYCGDPDLRDDDNIDGDELMVSAKKALQQVDMILLREPR